MTKSARRVGISRLTAAAVLAAAMLAGCKPMDSWSWNSWPWTDRQSQALPEPPVIGPSSPAPTASIASIASPTPVYIPQKRIETAKLFNGEQVQATLLSEPGGFATDERDTKGSYEIELNLKVKVPRPNVDLASLSKLNESLPQVLPGLTEMLPTAKTTSYEALYDHKLKALHHEMVRLDLLLSRHDFFDCETLVDLKYPKTGRAAVLLQADMDVDTDGSDGDRLPIPDSADPDFQPMTAYRWPKLTEVPNPFLASRQLRLHELESELAQAKGIGFARLQALHDKEGAARYEVNQLKKNSFLVAETDPYIVLPMFLCEGKDPAFSPRAGDYCVVIWQDRLFPAVVGDLGPNDKVGEASFRIAKEINPSATGLNRSVSMLKVTYLVFPNSAEKPAGPPNLEHWRARVEALLNEIGGYSGKLQTWENLSRSALPPEPAPAQPQIFTIITPLALPWLVPAPILIPELSGSIPTASSLNEPANSGASPAAPSATPSPAASP